MAFSYSDKNFTVIGNLCFVHIVLDGTETTFDIPSAILDRALVGYILCAYPYYAKNKARITDETPIIGFAYVWEGKIICSDTGDGYLSFYFPIDSNK